MSTELVPSIELLPGVVDRLRELALSAYPREACGVLCGKREPQYLRVVRAVEITNLAREASRFELDPGQLVARSREAQASGDTVVGIWHSHPDRATSLSAADRRHAFQAWEQVVITVDAQGRTELGWHRFRNGGWIRMAWREVEESRGV